MSRKLNYTSASLKTRSNALKAWGYLIIYPFAWLFKKAKRWYLKKRGKEEDLSKYLPKRK